MRLLLIAAFLLVTTTSLAQTPMPVQYPDKVREMSDADFHAWAVDYNEKQIADWNRRKAEITEPEWIYGTETRVEHDYYGAGSRAWESWDAYGRQAGYSSAPNGYYGAASEHTVTVPLRWRNPYYVGPGPLSLVNPFCPPKKALRE